MNIHTLPWRFRSFCRLLSHPTLPRYLLGGGAFFLTIALPAQITLNIDDVMVDFRNPCDLPVRSINLGDLAISLSRTDPNKGLRATFTVDAAVSGPKSGGTFLWDCMDLHYIQIITSDACPASVAGVKAGDPKLPFPVVDVPPRGWDYMYMDLDDPKDGIQADERKPDNPSDPTWKDDIVDTLPWYHTSVEEATVGGEFDRCVSYSISDIPGFCPDDGITAFSTYLVAEPRDTCYPDDCLDKGDLLLLTGFNWTWASNAIGISRILDLDATPVTNALKNTGFDGWDVFTEGTICCEIVPEPALASFFGVFLTLAFCTRRHSRP